jgi:hypothetical protein
MRRLVYECAKGSATVKTVSFTQASDLKMGGWNVTEVLETIPEPTSVAPKQKAARVKI